MTNGGENGTSGGGWRVGPWGVVALVGVVVGIITMTSDIMEGAGDHWSEPVLWEVTSAFVLIMMAPLVGWAVRRFPIRGDNLVQAGVIHLGLTVPYSLLHILAIWLMREAAYAAAGGRYGFFDDGVGIVVLYEWRKDVITYASIAAVYWWWQHRAERPPPERAGDDRIEIRDGGAAVFLNPRDLLWVEAAGNYVEFHTETRTHLARGTLAAWEKRLADKGFARVHRSRLVNRARIGAIKPTPSGDVELTLDDGRVVSGSRRYRGGLETTPSL